MCIPGRGGCTEEALSEWPSMLYLGGGCNTMWGCFTVYCEHCSITLNRNAVHEDVSASSPWTICLLQLIWLKSGKRAFIRFYVVISRSSFSLRLRLRASFSSPFWIPFAAPFQKDSWCVGLADSDVALCHRGRGVSVVGRRFREVSGLLQILFGDPTLPQLGHHPKQGCLASELWKNRLCSVKLLPRTVRNLLFTPPVPQTR